MLIMSTRPVAAIIQAVSPESILDGAPSASAGAAPDITASKTDKTRIGDALLVMDDPPEATPVKVSSPQRPGRQFPPARWYRYLERVRVGLTGADAYSAVDAGHEDLAVADLAGLGGVGDG